MFMPSHGLPVTTIHALQGNPGAVSRLEPILLEVRRDVY
jgi:hypothetical protein